MTHPAVLTENLTRVYAARRSATTVTALDSVSLRIEHGEVHGLLGPNGAGKSTLMKLLSTVLLPTSGRAEVCGHDVVTATKAVRPLISVVFGGERGLYPRLSARQNLMYWAALYGVCGRVAATRVEELLDRFDLRDRASDRVETYSAGMRQRLHLARGLIGNPRVLLLDEPTNALDPAAALRLRQTITEIAAQGRTILIATHDMHEAEHICDRVSLIDHGRLIATESPHALVTRVQVPTLEDAYLSLVGPSS
ncbi:ABC transporter ATP-binding protein [Allorhizocola rhizosphaerae]|uniref:ABC transporter ATP-binding protein n=1 Tax=Allorhizocola rhizosphaerae TaxID=1872709 RepID=UPI000E3CFAAD|nr:ABC transporter ATP-binding protein [Allorhizocola rhizosphaerae]